MISIPDENILFGVPKKGRLFDKIVKLLDGAGLEHYRPNRLDIAMCTGLPVTLVFLPAADVATYVGEGNVDIGITGQDIVAESETNVVELLRLGFGKCKLGIQAPASDCIKSPADLAGKRIVTSFPAITAKYFKQFEKNGVKTKIKYVSGSVEAACSLGLADGIVDLVETGTTMKAAGLEMVSTVMDTEAVLISNPNTKHPALVKKIHNRLLGYLTATKYRMLSYNIGKQLLEKAMLITPGRRSPTVNTLTGGQFMIISVMVSITDVADIMDALADLGATDIVVFHIENCRA